MMFSFELMQNYKVPVCAIWSFSLLSLVMSTAVHIICLVLNEIQTYFINFVFYELVMIGWNYKCDHKILPNCIYKLHVDFLIL